MPEVNFTPANQCTLSDPSDGDDAAYAPTEPARPAFDQPLACHDETLGSEGSSGDCAQELVERHRTESCADEALRAVGSCGAAALLATETAGLSLVFAGAACVGSLGALAECLERDDGVR